jgi:hypothetical protein
MLLDAEEKTILISLRIQVEFETGGIPHLPAGESGCATCFEVAGVESGALGGLS